MRFRLFIYAALGAWVYVMSIAEMRRAENFAARSIALDAIASKAVVQRNLWYSTGGSVVVQDETK